MTFIVVLISEEGKFLFLKTNAKIQKQSIHSLHLTDFFSEHFILGTWIHHNIPSYTSYLYPVWSNFIYSFRKTFFGNTSTRHVLYISEMTSNLADVSQVRRN